MIILYLIFANGIFANGIFANGQVGQAEPLTVRLVDGSLQQVQVTEITPSSVTLTGQGQEKILPVTEIGRIELRQRSHRRAHNKHTKIVLVDGSVIFADSLLITDGMAQIETPSGWTIENLDRDQIQFVELRQQTSPQFRGEWDDIVENGTLTSDRLIVKRNEHLDYVEGIVGDLTETDIGFRMGDREMTVGREKIEGWSYYQAAGRQLPAESCQLLTTDHALIKIVRGSFSQGQFEAELPCGAVIRLDTQYLVDFDFELGRAVWLSSLTPSTIQWTALIPNPTLQQYQQQLNQPRMNQAFDGETLSLVFAVEQDYGVQRTAKKFSNGIAVKGGTRLVFDLDSNYTRLTGLFGFSPDASSEGQVAVTLEGDGRQIKKWIVENRDFDPQPIDLSVENIERLTLRVDYHDGRNVGDIMHFCELKVIK